MTASTWIVIGGVTLMAATGTIVGYALARAADHGDTWPDTPTITQETTTMNIDEIARYYGEWHIHPGVTDDVHTFDMGRPEDDPNAPWFCHCQPPDPDINGACRRCLRLSVMSSDNLARARARVAAVDCHTPAA